MTEASLPISDESVRLAALDALALLDTPPEAEFDAIARLAAAATGCTTAAVALIDAHRFWIKAAIGEAPAQLPRREAFCDAVIRTDSAIVVEDATADPRFCNLPLVHAGVRFYAGEPLHVTDDAGARHAVGTLCVVDDSVRRLSDTQAAAFRDLARLAEALMTARKVARAALGHATALERQQRLFRQAERLAKVGWWRLDLDDDKVEWSDGIFRIHELERKGPQSLADGLDFYPPKSRAVVSHTLVHAIETGRPFDYEADFVTAQGNARRVRAMGEVEWAEGRPSAVLGVFRDVTEEHALALALRKSAETDPLTHIPNRGAFARRLGRAMDAARSENVPFALLLIDLDGFKRINDTFGHPVGDEVLKTVAARLHAPWLKGSCAARLGGDEFAVIVDDPVLLANQGLAASTEWELQLTTRSDGVTLESGASVGLMHFDPNRFETERAFIQAADAELYAAKRRRVGERRAA